MNPTDMKHIEQAARQELFPPDRIAFCASAATMDQVVLRRWACGEVTFDWLRARIAENNFLEKYFPNGMIPESMMRNELKIMGWSRRK